MMQSMINLLLMISTYLFTQLNHPLAMGFLMILQTILISLITGMMSETFWFSYILFLVFLGGMLVLFIYVTSLASNEMFTFSFKLMIISMLFFIVSLTILSIMNNTEYIFINNLELTKLEFSFMIQENFKSIYKLYNFSTNWITCLLINYLLFTLIVVVKITNFFYGPLRNLS